MLYYWKPISDNMDLSWNTGRIQKVYFKVQSIQEILLTSSITT